MLIYEGLEINDFPKVISLVGGGGKSTTMYRLAKELRQRGKKVLVTTTTHLALPKDDEMERLIIDSNYLGAIEKLHGSFEKHFIVGLATTKVKEKKIKGIPIDWIKWIKEENIVDIILVEADGAKGKPFKAPDVYEPVLPQGSDIVTIVVGIDALGKPITQQYVHRPEKILKLVNPPKDSNQAILTREFMAQVILHDEGLFKGIPEDSDVFILINKIDEIHMGQARDLAHSILSYKPPRNLKILLGQVQNPLNPILDVMEEKEK